MLGVHMSRCNAAARATGPIEQWGEIDKSCAAAMAAIFLLVENAAAVRYIHLHDVGCPPRDQAEEIGDGVQPLTRGNAELVRDLMISSDSTFSELTGSSNHAGRIGFEGVGNFQ